MSFISQWLAIACLILGSAPTIFIEAHRSNDCDCLVNLTIATICVSSYHGLNCAITFAGNSNDLCELGRVGILSYDLGANYSGMMIAFKRLNYLGIRVKDYVMFPGNLKIQSVD